MEEQGRYCTYVFPARLSAAALRYALCHMTCQALLRQPVLLIRLECSEGREGRTPRAGVGHNVAVSGAAVLGASCARGHGVRLEGSVY